MLFTPWQIELMGQSVYEFTHPCDHDEIKEILTNKQASQQKSSSQPENKIFFLRMKCTLTAKGRNVNLKSATFKVGTCHKVIITLPLQLTHLSSSLHLVLFYSSEKCVKTMIISLKVHILNAKEMWNSNIFLNICLKLKLIAQKYGFFFDFFFLLTCSKVCMWKGGKKRVIVNIF